MINLIRPDVGEEEIEAIKRAFSEGVLSTGEIVTEFEKRFSSYVERETAAAVNSGSTALELALSESGLQPGDGVLLSPFNCSAVLYPLLRNRLVPFFADIDTGTLNIDPVKIEERLDEYGEEISGILPVHLFGQPCEMGHLMQISNNYGLIVVEDFCQAPGAEYKGESVGSFGKVGVCSSGATKNITTAEGGMVVSDDSSLIKEVKSRRSNSGVNFSGKACELPMNVKLSDIAATIGLTQLDRYGEMIGRRRKIAEIYKSNLPSYVDLQKGLANTSHVYHRFVILTEHRDELVSFLNGKGIEATPALEKALYSYDAALTSSTTANHNYPESERAVHKGVLLPLHSKMAEEEAKRVTREVDEFFRVNS